MDLLGRRARAATRVATMLDHRASLDALGDVIRLIEQDGDRLAADALLSNVEATLTLLSRPHLDHDGDTPELIRRDARRKMQRASRRLARVAHRATTTASVRVRGCRARARPRGRRERRHVARATSSSDSGPADEGPSPAAAAREAVAA